MAYITLADIRKRDTDQDLINVTDPQGLAVDEAVVSQAIESAEAEVDSYISGRLRMPLQASEVSAQLKHFTLLVCRYYLYADRKTDAVIAEYERAIAWLKDVSAGRASSGVVQAVLPDDTVKGTSIVAPVAAPVFGAAFEAAYNVPFGPNGAGAFIGWGG